MIGSFSTFRENAEFPHAVRCGGFQNGLSWGVFKSAQQRATLIARTETLRAHNEGRKVFYREVGVKKVKWLTAHDERTCPECAPLDGRVFKIDEAPGPPRHPGCRCALSSVIET